MKDGIVIGGVEYELADCEIVVEGRVCSVCDQCDLQKPCNDSQEQFCLLFEHWQTGENKDRIFKKVKA